MFNLCVSALVAQNALDEAKSTFIMSIGKTKLRENLKAASSSSGRNELNPTGKAIGGSGNNKSFQMLASVFPLVDKDFPRRMSSNADAHELKNSIDKLIQNNLDISKRIYELLK